MHNNNTNKARRGLHADGHHGHVGAERLRGPLGAYILYIYTYNDNDNDNDNDINDINIT